MPVTEQVTVARALDALSTPGGGFMGLALDHRDAFVRALAASGLSMSAPEMAALKAEVVAALAPAASLVLLDAAGFEAAAAAGAIPAGVAFGVPLESQGYGDVAQVATTTLVEDSTPESAAAAGASACKLLLPFRVDRDAQADRQEAVARTVADRCRAAGIALILEPIVYRESGEQLPAAELGSLVVEGARRLSRVRPGILKVQYPGDGRCEELDAACGAATPWVLLGGGADGAELERQTSEACRAGASGVIAGRTLWAEALVADAALRATLLGGVLRDRIDRLAAVVEEQALPWRTRAERPDASSPTGAAS